MSASYSQNLHCSNWVSHSCSLSISSDFVVTRRRLDFSFLLEKFLSGTLHARPKTSSSGKIFPAIKRSGRYHSQCCNMIIFNAGWEIHEWHLGKRRCCHRHHRLLWKSLAQVRRAHVGLVRFPNPLATGSEIRGSWGTWPDLLDTLWPSHVAGSLPMCTAARRIISTWKRLCCETSLFKIFNLCLIHYIGHSGGKHPIKPLAEKNVFLSCTSKFDLFLTKKNYSNQGRAEL